MRRPRCERSTGLSAKVYDRFAHAAQQPRIRILHRTEIADLAQDEQGVTASAVELASGRRSTIECDSFVECSRASSLVRKSIASEFLGAQVLQYAHRFTSRCRS